MLFSLLPLDIIFTLFSDTLVLLYHGCNYSDIL